MKNNRKCQTARNTRNVRVKNAWIWNFYCINWRKGKSLTVADVSQLLMFQRRLQERATTWASPTWTPTIIIIITIIIPNTTSTTIGLKTEFHRPPRCLPCYAASQYRLAGLGPISNSCWTAAWASQDQVLVPSRPLQPLRRSPSIITAPYLPRLLSTRKRTATTTTATSTVVASITSTITTIIITTIFIIFIIISTCR